MPVLMDKADWMQTVADVGAAESIWYENVSADGGCIPLSMPESGTYRVILVKIGSASRIEKPKCKSARDYIGYSRKYYHGRTSTAEIMQELREGETGKRPIADVLIGAFAMRKGGLITRNEADFRSLYPGLTIFNPLSLAT